MYVTRHYLRELQTAIVANKDNVYIAYSQTAYSELNDLIMSMILNGDDERIIATPKIKRWVQLGTETVPMIPPEAIGRV